MARGVLEHWKIIAPRKTMFFLAKNSLVAISDLLASTMLDEITEWRATGGVPVDMGDRWFAVEVRAQSRFLYIPWLQCGANGSGMGP